MYSKVSLVAAPTALSPGGYVSKAYAGRSAPQTPVAELDATKSAGHWRVRIAWACAKPIRELGEDVDRFVDAAAILAPGAADSPWMTMGAPGKSVEGVLWRADRDELFGVRAEGLGTVERSAATSGWTARAEWKAGRWKVEFDLPGWVVLEAREQLAFAIWQGALGDRAGLKSVSPGWLEVGS